jgi:hypothetical protein
MFLDELKGLLFARGGGGVVRWLRQHQMVAFDSAHDVAAGGVVTSRGQSGQPL